MDKKDIKTIEDLSLNAWPSHQMQIYDGWILRFSHYYTHRTNCVEQIGSAQIPWEDKINYCERIYRRWNTPCIFKITPLTDPAFDKMLEERGYQIEHVTDVMCCDLKKRNFPSHSEVCVETRISDEWIDALFAIKENATVTHLKIVPSMYAAIPKDVICAHIRKDGRIIATGLGILDRDQTGIYAINVDKRFRRQGLARKICETLLSEAGRYPGVDKSYLQVISGNTPAISLYESLGFRKEYEYWFRVKQL